MSENNIDRTEETQSGGVMVEVYEWLEAIAFALAIVVILFTFVFRVVSVSGPSMQPTLYTQDRIVLNSIFFTPQNGDIVVITQPNSHDNEPLIKRVVAVEGQTIDIDFVNGIVYVDEIPLDEPYVNELTYDREDFEGPVEVPEGCVFVMGDNRNNSTDSRRVTIGCVDTRYIMGKVIFRILPLNKMGAIYGWEY